MSPSMSDADFAEWYVSDIMMTEFPDFVADLGRADCARRTRMGRRYATHFAITRPDIQGEFLTLMWALGPNFFEGEAFARILARKDMSQTDRMDALYAVSDAEGGKAFERADDRYWTPWLLGENILGLKEDPEWTE